MNTQQPFAWPADCATTVKIDSKTGISIVYEYSESKFLRAGKSQKTMGHTQRINRSGRITTSGSRTSRITGSCRFHQVVLQPGSISAWHAHGSTTDQLFVSSGQIHLVLYDSRSDSPTNGLVNEFQLSDHRPMLVVVPPRIWHGIINRSSENAILLNATDLAYCYETPDHWRVPPDSPHIPYSMD